MRICIAPLLASVLVAQKGVVRSEFVFESAPFPSCHASTIAETKSGLVAAWFGGKDEKHPDVGIWVSRLVDRKWTAPVEVADGVQFLDVEGKAHRHPCWNPVLFQPRADDRVKKAGFKTKAKNLTKAVSNKLPDLKSVKRVGYGKYQLSN